MSDDCSACEAIDSAVVLNDDGQLMSVTDFLSCHDLYRARCPECAERKLAAIYEEEDA